MWFRFYVETLDDPKVQRLEADLFKFWVNLLCLAKRHNGILPSIDDISFALRETKETVSLRFKTLESHGLVDAYRDGYEMHNWRKRQYKSDTSTERVKRFRKRSRNVSETPPETETETETETEKKEKDLSANADPSLLTNDVEKAVYNWNVTAAEIGLSPVNKFTSDRRRKLRARLDEHGLEGWNSALENLERSEFCRGKNDRGWRANFDFMLQQSSLNKLIEGTYGNGATERF